MRDRLEHLESALRQLRVEQLGEARSEQRVLVHDHDGLRRLAGRIVDGGEIVERGLGDDAEARTEAEGVLEAAGDDAVGDPHVDHVGKVVARGGLARRQADRAAVAADDGGDAGGIHLLDLGGAALGRRLGIAQHRLDLGAIERLDAAGGIDFLDRDLGAEPALLARIRQGAAHRMQHAELHAGTLRADDGGRREQAGRRGGDPDGRCGQELAAAETTNLIRHLLSPALVHVR